jgi:hypothetical protein
MQRRLRNAQVLLAAASPEGDHRWVLHQNQAIGRRPVGPFFNQGKLTLKSVIVP